MKQDTTIEPEARNRRWAKKPTPVKPLDTLGGEPLTGSGFENEVPESEFRSDQHQTPAKQG
jgi:hypothetical protein